MCAFVDVPFDVVVVEQSPDGAFNKGSLFNVGYQLTAQPRLHDLSHAEYSDAGGYSNLFVGWGMEDHNMGWRVRKHMGYGKLDGPVGRYTALAHTRVMGLDLTEQYGRNAERGAGPVARRGRDPLRRARRDRDALRRRMRRDRDGGALRVARANATGAGFDLRVAAPTTGPGALRDVAAARDALAAIRADAGARRRCARREGRCVSKASAQ
ncbi:N-acetyllactosamine synthase [Aureococcus anophagefferens]|uniref:N-acetyllactosamine synthase n=1 Tax=Aureococcus anophagefferens TaxID=44056 RepID=A0ABR1FWH6_AURAN